MTLIRFSFELAALPDTVQAYISNGTYESYIQLLAASDLDLWLKID